MKRRTRWKCQRRGNCRYSTLITTRFGPSSSSPPSYRSLSSSSATPAFLSPSGAEGIPCVHHRIRNSLQGGCYCESSNCWGKRCKMLYSFFSRNNSLCSSVKYHNAFDWQGGHVTGNGGSAATSNGVATIRESDSTQRGNDRSLATILVGIVLVFMVCHACRFFLAFYQVQFFALFLSCMPRSQLGLN